MSPLESLIVLPQLSDSSMASSSAFCSTRSASLKSKRPRSAASIVLHGPVSRARRAALTALSTSAAPAAATLAITSPVAGLKVSNSPPSTGSVHLLSMNSFVSLIFGRDVAAQLSWAWLFLERCGRDRSTFRPESSGAHVPKSSPRRKLGTARSARSRASVCRRDLERHLPLSWRRNAQWVL